MPYIIKLHNDDPFWHISIDLILLDTSKGLVELPTTMVNLNK
jgi:hypothetical protein